MRLSTLHPLTSEGMYLSKVTTERDETHEDQQEETVPAGGRAPELPGRHVLQREALRGRLHQRRELVLRHRICLRGEEPSHTLAAMPRMLREGRLAGTRCVHVRANWQVVVLGPEAERASAIAAQT